jgi:deazaflavin-dependent oxidoreductase (nitroreductase family)
MPMPLWFGHINKRLFNKRELNKGVRPVITHIGRRSGTIYRTPLEVTPVDGGYIVVLVYGSASDWVKNVLAAGSATLRIGGEDIELTSPRVLDEHAAWQLLPTTKKRPPRFLKIDEYLHMDVLV